MSHLITPLALCGGMGSRLWPMSRIDQPKQFQPVKGAGSLSFFQATLQRHRGPGFADPIVVTSARHGMIVARQLREVQLRGRIIAEPVARNTGPAVLAAALDVLSRNADAKLLVLPSDHVITGDLSRTVLAMRSAADQGRIVTFGITPDSPETGFGYITDGGALADYPGLHRVDRFVEKPTFDVASALLADGNSYWASGISLFRADVLVAEFQRLAPHTYHAVLSAWQQAREMAFHLLLDENTFAKAENEPTERLIFERTDRISLAPVRDIEWDDVGAWNAVHKISKPGSSGNVTTGDVIAVDTRNSLIRGRDNRLIAVVGMRDVIVVDTPDALLVTNRANAQNVKGLVEELKKNARPEVQSHPSRDTGWGRIERLADAQDCNLDLLTVEPGATVLVNGTGESQSLVTFLTDGGSYQQNGRWIAAASGHSVQVNSTVVLPVSNTGLQELRLVKLALTPARAVPSSTREAELARSVGTVI
ncbi:MAG: sugar phosphate nucleotidyltransferase [Pseudomonadota bacterium]